MSQNTVQKLQRELNSLFGLTIINIVASSLAMAFGVYFFMPNLISAVTTFTITVEQIGLIILGGLALVVAIRWLVNSAEMIELYSNLSDKFSRQKKDRAIDDEKLTGLIVDLTAAYRENKPTIKLMMIISRIAGIGFGIAAVLSLGSLIAGAMLNVPLWSLAQISTVTINGVMSAVCFLIPHFYRKYSNIWDQRLLHTEKVEAELNKVLG